MISTTKSRNGPPSQPRSRSTSLASNCQKFIDGTDNRTAGFFQSFRQSCLHAAFKWILVSPQRGQADARNKCRAPSRGLSDNLRIIRYPHIFDAPLKLGPPNEPALNPAAEHLSHPSIVPYDRIFSSPYVPWINPATGQRQLAPRQAEIDGHLVRHTK